MKLGQCKLCLRQDKLEHSHVIPSFVIRWLKTTSGTGFLRHSQTINRRVQDGYKEYWLCPGCEDLFSKWESEFASNVFYPLASGQATQFHYQEWLLKFAVSLSWRNLLHIKELYGLNIVPEAHRNELECALHTWSEFLLGRKPHVGKYEQHLLPVDAVANHTIKDMPTNINRYLLRSVDIAVACSDRQSWVYVKLPYIILIGFIHAYRPGIWEGTKVHVKQGTLGRSQYKVPKEFLDYMLAQAQEETEIQKTISGRQEKIIEKSLMKNIGTFAASESFKATHADVKLFGREAFTKPRKS